MSTNYINYINHILEKETLIIDDNWIMIQVFPKYFNDLTITSLAASFDFTVFNSWDVLITYKNKDNKEDVYNILYSDKSNENDINNFISNIKKFYKNLNLKNNIEIGMVYINLYKKDNVLKRVIKQDKQILLHFLFAAIDATIKKNASNKYSLDLNDIENGPFVKLNITRINEIIFFNLGKLNNIPLYNVLQNKFFYFFIFTSFYIQYAMCEFFIIDKKVPFEFINKNNFTTENILYHNFIYNYDHCNEVINEIKTKFPFGFTQEVDIYIAVYNGSQIYMEDSINIENNFNNIKNIKKAESLSSFLSLIEAVKHVK